MPAALAPIAGSVVGGLMSDGGGSSQTASKDPWGPAVEPLTNSLATGQDLERYYQQTPFNPLQQQGYQNLYSDLDQFRSQLSPQLMQFANSMMQSNYQRGPRNSQMEAMGRPLQQQMPQQYQTKPMQMQGGLLAASQSTMPQSGLPLFITSTPFKTPPVQRSSTPPVGATVGVMFVRVGTPAV